MNKRKKKNEKRKKLMMIIIKKQKQNKTKNIYILYFLNKRWVIIKFRCL